MPIYTDLSLRFTRHPVTDDVAKLVDSDAVQRSVRHLLMTSVYERPFEPGIGTRLQQLLFEPLDTVTEKLIVDEIKGIIDRFEPRVQLLAVTMVPRPDENSYEATIEYRILNIPAVQRVNVVLARIR